MPDPAESNLFILRGKTFEKRYLWISAGNPVDITSYTARVMIRENKSDSTPFISISSAGGEIVLGGVAGTIDITIADTTTNAIDSAITHGFWALEMTSPLGVIQDIAAGAVKVADSATR